MLIKIKFVLFGVNFKEDIAFPLVFLRSLSALSSRHIALHRKDLAECFVPIRSIHCVFHFIRPENCVTSTCAHL